MTHVPPDLKTVATLSQSSRDGTRVEQSKTSPEIPFEAIRLCSHLPESEGRPAVRRVAISVFDAFRSEDILSLGERDRLKGEVDEEAKLLKARYDDLHTAAPLEIYYLADKAALQPLGLRLSVLGLNIGCGVMAVSAMYVYAVWIVKSELFDDITTIAAALPLALVPASAGIALPLAYYHTLRDGEPKDAFRRRISLLGIRLGMGLLASFTIATLLDTYVTDSAGHAASGLIMALAPAVRALALALCIPTGIGAEAAAAVAIKILAGKVGRQGLKMTIVTNPAPESLGKLRDAQAARVKKSHTALSELKALESRLANEREAFALICEGALAQLHQHRRHAGAGAELQTGTRGRRAPTTTQRNAA
jgi:hypothetical protein